MLTLITIVSLIIVLVLIFIGVHKKNKINEESIEDINDNSRRNKYIFALILLFSIVILVYKLGIVPYGLHVDEAGMAYDALSLSNYGVDRFLYNFPVYFINFGGGQNALYTYLAAIVVKIVGYSVTTIRIPAVLLGISSIIVMYKMIKENKSSKVALVACFIMAICPFHIMKSRWGLESYLLFPLLLISMYLLLKAINTKKNIYYVFAGILFGITLYTYAVSYLIIPIFLIFILIYLLRIKKINFKNILFFGIPLVVIALPLVLMLAINSGILPNEITTNFLSIPKLWQFRGGEFALKNIIENLNIFGVLLSKDFLVYNGFSKFGTLYYISIPFLIYGFIKTIISTKKAIQKKEFSIDYVMLVAFIVILFVSLLTSSININKANAMFIPFIYFIAIGITNVIKNRKKFGYIIFILYMIHFIYFANYYFVEYPKTVRDTTYFVSVDDLNEAIDAAKLRTDDTIYISGNNFVQPYIYALLYDELSPYDFASSYERKNDDVISYGRYKFEFNEEIDTDGVYIIFNNDEFMESLIENGFIRILYGNYNVLYYGG